MADTAASRHRPFIHVSVCTGIKCIHFFRGRTVGSSPTIKNTTVNHMKMIGQEHTKKKKRRDQPQPTHTAASRQAHTQSHLVEEQLKRVPPQAGAGPTCAPASQDDGGGKLDSARQAKGGFAFDGEVPPKGKPRGGPVGSHPLQRQTVCVRGTKNKRRKRGEVAAVSRQGHTRTQTEAALHRDEIPQEASARAPALAGQRQKPRSTTRGTSSLGGPRVFAREIVRRMDPRGRPQQHRCNHEALPDPVTHTTPSTPPPARP